MGGVSGTWDGMTGFGGFPVVISGGRASTVGRSAEELSGASLEDGVEPTPEIPRSSSAALIARCRGTLNMRVVYSISIMKGTT